MGRSRPSIQSNWFHGLDGRSFAAETTPRTHFFPAFPLARSNAACNARDHFRTVFGLTGAMDYAGEAPPSLANVQKPENSKQAEFIRKVARTLRSAHASRYPTLADGVEKELALAMDDFRTRQRRFGGLVGAEC